MTMRLIILMTIMTLASVLTGCGQKGLLYLPEPELPPPLSTTSTSEPKAETKKSAEQP
ncbi:MAG: putative small lipoprotein YifL [Pseudohongiellaceae bacterium]|jgi:predicted small lipoprotein YifL